VSHNLIRLGQVPHHFLDLTLVLEAESVRHMEMLVVMVALAEAIHLITPVADLQ
tara:strand:+ start:323 stop:484 length:162 start_codon:yes stop_codon:yes gene_type:complete